MPVSGCARRSPKPQRARLTKSAHGAKARKSLNALRKGKFDPARRVVVGPRGLEPRTYGLRVRCSTN